MPIRPATAEDAAAITVLLHQLGYPEAPDSVRARLAALCDRTDAVVLVSEDERHRINGCAHVLIDLRLAEGLRGEISSIVVAAGARGRGVGAGLVAAAHQWLRDRGIARMRVRCNTVRERAHRFYEQLGYQSTKTQKVFDIALVSGSNEDSGASS